MSPMAVMIYGVIVSKLKPCMNPIPEENELKGIIPRHEVIGFSRS